MYCLRWFMPLFLLPLPGLSPLTLALFLASYCLQTRPCMYCSAILLGVFASTCYWRGAFELGSPLPPKAAALVAAASDAPRVCACWISHGISWTWLALFDPLPRPGPSAPAQPIASLARTAAAPPGWWLGLPHSSFGVYVHW